MEVWPYSVGMLVKWVAFLHSLHWPADGCSLGVGGVSHVVGICLQDFGDLFLVILVLIIVGCGILGGSGVVLVLLPGPVSPRLRIF